MKATIDLAVHTLGPVLYAVLLGGAALGLLIGVMLIVDSERVLRWNYALNDWYSTRKAMRPLEEPVDVKRLIYRWHRVLGLLVFGGAVFALDALAFGIQTAALARTLRHVGSPAVLELAFEAVRIFLIVGNVAALAAGAVLVFRPSLLKGLEAWGDRQYSGRAPTKPLDIMRYQPDDFVRARPRIVGLFILIGSLYALFALGLALL